MNRVRRLLGAIKGLFTATETGTVADFSEAPKAPLNCPECGHARMQSAMSKKDGRLTKTDSCQNRDCDWTREWSE